MPVQELITPQHPEGLTEQQEFVIASLYDLDGIRFRPEGYRWRIHESHPEAPLMPIYTDFRMLRREPSAKKAAVDVYESLTREVTEFELLADIPTAATPLISSLADRLRVGHVTPRMDSKTHGSGAKVDGWKESDKGKIVLMGDDLSSFSDSKLEAADVLREVGAVVNGAMVLMDYGLGAREKMKEHGLELYAAFAANQMLDYSLRIGRLPMKRYNEVKDRLEQAREYFKNI